MEVLLKHWLGTTWLVLGVAAMAITSQDPKHPPILLLALSSVFFWVWVIRGFVRFLGRAWHHSITESKRTVR
jgi:hypothetical protein